MSGAQFKKLVVKGTLLQELLVEKISWLGDLKTIKVLRERQAAPREMWQFEQGHGWLLKFDRPPRFPSKEGYSNPLFKG